MFKWFKKKLIKNSNFMPTENTDSFADTLLVELKAASTDAITNAVNKIEGKYMRSVLEESVFPLQSLTFVPSDIEVARALEEFFRVHEEINPDFRKVFCNSFLQREYFSDRGARVIVEEGLTPVFKIDVKSLEEKSEDERYLISIQGRKILFSSHAILGNPRKKIVGRENNISSDYLRSDGIKTEIMLEVLVSDRNGHRTEKVTVPTLLGKNPDNACRDFGITPVFIKAKYVSRHQIFIFSILDKVFYFIPEEATLTCRNKEGDVLERGRNYPVKLTGERLYLGVPPEKTGPLTGNVDPAEFPVLEIQPLSHKGTSASDKTPRPTIS